MVDAIDAVERRRRLLRGTLLAIIIGTIPFYCLGFWLWGTAPQAEGRRTPTATATAIGGGTPSRTPTVLVTTTPNPTSTIGGPPTSSGGGGFPVPTAAFPTAFFPSSTPAPSFTPFPTSTFIPPSATPFPSDTWTPLPPATNTPFIVPTATWTTFILPTNTALPLPSNTPDGGGGVPTVAVTVIVGTSTRP